MTRNVAGSDDGDIETWPGGERNNEPDVTMQELNGRWKAMLEISTQIEPLELRKKFLELVNSEHEVKDQYTRLLYEKKKSDDKALIESAILKREISKLREDFEGAQHQIAGLQQQLREGRRVARSTDATPTIVPRKRPRIEYYSDEDEDPDDPPCKARANSSHFSREKIGSILGGIDRGWGTTKGRSGTKYAHHALFNGDHFFGQSPSREQDVAKVVFGIGQMDNGLISRAFEFPLFFSRPDAGNKNRTHFTYLGNYTAVKLDPVAWERLSTEVQEYVVQAVCANGLSTTCSLQNIEKNTPHSAIRYQFECGTHNVPCCKLEFRYFDEDLNADIKNSRGRRR